MAIILHIETATTNCSVSVAKDGKLLAIKEQDTPNYSHSEQLHVFINDVLQVACLKIADLDAISVSKGPGSYTGLRIGVSAAKGLCFARDIPLLSLPTLQIMQLQVPSSNYDFIIPLLDARRMEVYSAVFDTAGKQVRETRAEIIDDTSFLEFLNRGKLLLVGSGAEKCKAFVTHPNLEFKTALVPSAREMCQLSFKNYEAGNFENVAYFEPYYLKDFLLQRKHKP
ncbi:MAG: tRNA (adenosine(37)-N6)-threonylcarbamoyltransferase complex dimerization subunit type 1 TsaB [Maribacter sp.]|nr:tRNA (adenosine(37)-N6)-threonylcarbamoyltransferase complex dimerization subunit type 1 TsaB [Maribacter sp.]